VTWTRRQLLVDGAWLALAGAAGCGNGTRTQRATPLPPLEERGPDRVQLARDVEGVVRESYVALSGHYDEAYLDNLAHEKSLILVDVAPGAVQIGYSPAAVELRHIFPGFSTELVSKRLEVTLSADATCAWTVDEVSHRVLHEGRRLIVPVRVTQLFERRNGRWTVVMIHTSYAMPLTALGAVLNTSEGLGLVAPTGSDVQKGREASAVMAVLQSQPWRTAKDALVLGPFPGQEWRGADAAGAASPTVLFTGTQKAELTQTRVRVSATGQVAWGIGLVEVQHQLEGDLFTVPMRVSWVFTRGPSGWAVSQLHAQVPVPPAALAYYALGGSMVAPAAL
jgi:ketosteroid isomerase-like protein